MSDMHFTSGQTGRDESYIDLSRHRVDKQDPIEDLYRYITGNALKADILMCPGDITVAADEVALKAAWDAVQRTAGLLGADNVFAATGNHDIASRDPGNEPEIWERLKLLSPPYPSPGLAEIERLRYWADHYLVARVGELRIIVLNTCNTHARGEKEFQRGRITDYTLQRILEMTPADSSVRMNILLCHHHPLKYADLDQSIADYSEMVQGTKLLEELERAGQPWLVIHGHKHYPKVGYASGSSEAPTVFSAGSLSAVLSPVYFNTALNQFYIIDIDMDDVARWGLVGTIRAWDWVKSVGWSAADSSELRGGRIVSGSGFGYRANLREIESKISDLVHEGIATSWDLIEEKFPQIKYLLFDDRQRLMSRLAQIGIRAVGDSVLKPLQLLRSGS